MADVALTFTVSINAPVHAVFEYCRDPRRIYAEDPTYTVSDATLTPDGVGTRTHAVARMGPFAEDVPIEYVEVVPDQRIVFTADPKVTARRGRWVISGDDVHTWTWTFAPEDGGTRLGVVVVSKAGPRWRRLLDRVGNRMCRSRDQAAGAYSHRDRGRRSSGGARSLRARGRAGVILGGRDDQHCRGAGTGVST